MKTTTQSGQAWLGYERATALYGDGATYVPSRAVLVLLWQRGSYMMSKNEQKRLSQWG
jgi:hypothetical protein